MTQQQPMPPAAQPGTPEADRIRGYLQTQAAKLSLAELCTKVRADIERVREALLAAPAERFTARPSEGEWSPNEIAGHLTSTSRVIADGILQVLDGGERPGGITDEMRTTDQVHTAERWWELLLTDRERVLARVAEATGDEHPEVKWPHSVFGDLSWREWLLFLRVHDLDHARQLAAATAELAEEADD